VRPSTNPPSLQEIISNWEALERVPESLPNEPDFDPPDPGPSADIKDKVTNVFAFDGLPDGAMDHVPDAPSLPFFEDDFIA
jgi:hypothetical protein